MQTTGSGYGGWPHHSPQDQAIMQALSGAAAAGREIDALKPRLSAAEEAIKAHATRLEKIERWGQYGLMALLLAAQVGPEKALKALGLHIGG